MDETVEVAAATMAEAAAGDDDGLSCGGGRWLKRRQAEMTEGAAGNDD